MAANADSTGKIGTAWRLQGTFRHQATCPRTTNHPKTMNTIFYIVGAVVVIGFILKMLGVY